MAVEMAAEMAVAVVMVVVVAMQWTPSIRLILEDDVANALSRLVKQFFDSLYLGIVKVTVVRKNGTGERCNSFADSGKRVPLRLSEAFRHSVDSLTVFFEIRFTLISKRVHFFILFFVNFYTTLILQQLKRWIEGGRIWRVAAFFFDSLNDSIAVQGLFLEGLQDQKA
jgi:hypothetical protein